MSKKVAVIGGGVAGMEASAYLAALGYEVTLLEKENQLGGHLLKWKHLFPYRRPGKEVVSYLGEGVKSQNIKVILNTNITNIENANRRFLISLSKDTEIEADAILMTTGYDLFDAKKKEEYGYGIYNNVITSAELEEIFVNGEDIRTTAGKIPSRIGIIHCVGSRDEKIGNLYCSKVCCVTGVKQAIELKERLPECDISCFYMDIRMFDRHFEELYLEAQEKYNINFIRGRLSEACENTDGSILIKVEDTLVGRPLKMSVDMLVLLVGFVPSEGSRRLGDMLKMDFDTDGFIKTRDENTERNISTTKGVFLAGACTGPVTIANTLADARAAALKIAGYLENFTTEERKTDSR